MPRLNGLGGLVAHHRHDHVFDLLSGAVADAGEKRNKTNN
jgi:hypothetical protein